MCIYINTVHSRYCTGYFLRMHTEIQKTLNTHSMYFFFNIYPPLFLFFIFCTPFSMAHHDTGVRSSPTIFNGHESTSSNCQGENTDTFGFTVKGNRREWERCSALSLYEMIIYTFGVSVHSFDSASRLCARYETRQARRAAAGI